MIKPKNHKTYKNTEKTKQPKNMEKKKFFANYSCMHSLILISVIS